MSNEVDATVKIITVNDTDHIYSHTYVYIPSFVLELKVQVDNL